MNIFNKINKVCNNILWTIYITYAPITFIVILSVLITAIIIRGISE